MVNCDTLLFFAARKNGCLLLCVLSENPGLEPSPPISPILPASVDLCLETTTGLDLVVYKVFCADDVFLPAFAAAFPSAFGESLDNGQSAENLTQQLVGFRWSPDRLWPFVRTVVFATDNQDPREGKLTDERGKASEIFPQFSPQELFEFSNPGLLSSFRLAEELSRWPRGGYCEHRV